MTSTSAGGRPDAGMRATRLLDSTPKASAPRLTLDRHVSVERAAPRRRSRPVSRAISAVSCAGSTGFGKSLCTARSICRDPFVRSRLSRQRGGGYAAAAIGFERLDLADERIRVLLR